jgi:hypothetical protein
VTRGADGAPTYTVACPPESTSNTPCAGRVQLERPPAAGSRGAQEVLGTGSFTNIPAGQKADVPVALNDAGKALLATPGAAVSVRVLIGETTSSTGTSYRADFGWQQILGPP